jgi:hypothetical protein
VGIQEERALSVLVYPNPTAAHLYFSQQLMGAVYNNVGEIVTTLNNQRELDCSQFASGLYVIRTDKNLIRFIVERP